MNLKFSAMVLSSILLGNGSPSGLACTVSGPVSTGLQVKAMGIEGSFYYHQGAPLVMQLTNRNDETVTLCVTFKDGDGNPIGGPTQVSLPGGTGAAIPAPEGASQYDVSPGFCDEESANQAGGGADTAGASGSSGSDLGGIGPVRQRSSYYFAGGPILPDFADPGVTYALTVFATGPEEAVLMRDAILDRGLTRRLPRIQGVKGVDVHYYLEAEFDLLTGNLNLTFANDDPFTLLDIGLNGDPQHASLEDTTLSGSAQGWEVRSISLPSEDFNYTPQQGAQWRNDYDIAFLNGNDASVSHHQGHVVFESQ